MATVRGSPGVSLNRAAPRPTRLAFMNAAAWRAIRLRTQAPLCNGLNESCYLKATVNCLLYELSVREHSLFICCSKVWRWLVGLLDKYQNINLEKKNGREILLYFNLLAYFLSKARRPVSALARDIL